MHVEFFLREGDVGKNRAAVTAERLSELNPYVPVSVVDGELTEEVLQRFSAIVLTNSTLDEQLRVDKFLEERVDGDDTQPSARARG